MSSNPETDKKIYAESMVLNAFRKLWGKETNNVDVSYPNRSMKLIGAAEVDDETDERIFTIQVRAKK